MTAGAPILGAIVAGGQARRFGSDKALALYQGKPLIGHAIDTLRPQVAALVLCGRGHAGIERIEDRPEPGLGPMGGINAALHRAAASGLRGVLSVPVDVLPLPGDLVQRLGTDALACFDQQFLVAFWPVELAAEIDDYVTRGGRKPAELLDRLGARRVADPPGIANVNRPRDLARLGRDIF
ncbi:molybdenum cofactor guanylyltransferase [Croceicoccus marinus]|uniref:Molybdenum cofactor guanylyltransferase n=1 Tax=Croceicoccus marinus TaxID=450378 RepID=A0A1Z1FDY3_9SPHN|nr:molybdenum cofactor guanylyltransferase [Croceicoccus marinus]ARU16913.1 hypothetical protein A9D14_12980 [Croceicoccus marinus]